MLVTYSLLLMGSAPLTAPTIPDVWVDASAPACDAADGTFSLPFCTIQAAISAAAPGENVVIRPGVYAENLVLTANQRLIAPRGPEVTIIDGTSSGTVIEIAQGLDVLLNGLQIRGGFSDQSMQGAGISSRGRLVLLNCTLRGNESTANLSAGACLSLGPIVVENCLIEDNRAGSGSASAISVNGNGPNSILNTTIAGNRTTQAEGATVSIVSALATLIRSSTISGNDAPGIAFFRGSSQLPDPGRATINGCTIVDNGGSTAPSSPLAGGVTAAFVDVTVLNSIIAGNVSASGPDDARGNFISAGPNAIGVNRGSTGWTNPISIVGSANFPADPALEPLAHTGGRLPTHRPSANSPVIDLGTNQPSSADQRNVRHARDARDLGAHERSVGTSISACVPTPNRTGRTGRLIASANLDPTEDSMYLTMLDLPGDSFGFCVTSPATTAPFQPLGAGGIFCLGGGVGRITGPNQVSLSDPSGRTSIRLDLDQHPTPAGAVSVLSGETWYFQGWHRDAIQGMATSNFTEAISVTFL